MSEPPAQGVMGLGPAASPAPSPALIVVFTRAAYQTVVPALQKKRFRTRLTASRKAARGLQCKSCRICSAAFSQKYGVLVPVFHCESPASASTPKCCRCCSAPARSAAQGCWLQPTSSPPRRASRYWGPCPAPLQRWPCCACAYASTRSKPWHLPQRIRTSWAWLVFTASYWTMYVTHSWFPCNLGLSVHMLHTCDLCASIALQWCCATASSTALEARRVAACKHQPRLLFARTNRSRLPYWELTPELHHEG